MYSVCAICSAFVRIYIHVAVTGRNWMLVLPRTATRVVTTWGIQHWRLKDAVSTPTKHSDAKTLALRLLEVQYKKNPICVPCTLHSEQCLIIVRLRKVQIGPKCSMKVWWIQQQSTVLEAVKVTFWRSIHITSQSLARDIGCWGFQVYTILHCR